MKTTSRKPQVKTTNPRPQIDTTDDWFGVRQRLEFGDQQRGAVAAGDGRALPWRKSGKAVVPPIDRAGKRSDPLPFGLDAQKVFANLEKFRESGLVAVECYRDEGWPWVRISYDKIVSPMEVLAVGDAIQSGLPPEGKVLFQMLRPESIYFIIDGIPLRQTESDAKLYATDYGVALDALEKGWLADPSPQVVAAQAQA
ncbi:MAG: hypothetical protein ACXWVP_04850, partial [Burkholderiales bacterium]